MSKAKKIEVQAVVSGVSQEDGFFMFTSNRRHQEVRLPLTSSERELLATHYGKRCTITIHLEEVRD